MIHRAKYEKHGTEFTLIKKGIVSDIGAEGKTINITSLIRLFEHGMTQLIVLNETP